MEDDQIITAAAYLIAFRAVVNAPELTMDELAAQISEFGKVYEHILTIIENCWSLINDMVGMIYDVTVPQ